MKLYPSQAMILSALVLTGLSLAILGFLAGRLIGISIGFEQGESKAINPRNPSERLEMACAGLWIGEQNQKYYDKFMKGEK